MDKEYHNYMLEDFIQDDSFLDWVQKKDSQSVEFWEEWLQRYPNKRELVEEARTFVEAFSEEMDRKPYPTQVEEELYAKIQTTLQNSKSRDRRWFIPLSNRNIYSIAASFTLLLLGTWLIYVLLNQKADWIEVETAYEEIKELVLPDGSEVTLNANSSLRYKRNWQAGEIRVVHLEGEAYFKVKKKPQTQAKFEVVVADLYVQVLGTQFNVNSRDMATRVFLAEGKVKIKLDGQNQQALLLKPGEAVNYSSKSKHLTKPVMTERKLETSWRQGTLEFKETSLEEILLKFSESHQFDFKIPDSGVAEEVYTLSLPTGNIDLAMQLLKNTTGCKISKLEDEYIFELRTEAP